MMADPVTAADARHWGGVWRVVVGAGLWGSIGIFVDALGHAGLSVLDMAAARVLIAWCALAPLALSQPAPGVRIRLRDTPFFVVYGFVSVALYTMLYFVAIRREGMAVAAALLSTTPLWTVVLARIFLRERILPLIALAVVVGMAGTLLVIGVGPGALFGSGLGIIAGLASALCWSLFSIFGKSVQVRYSPLTSLFYSFIVGGVLLAVVAAADGGIARVAALDFRGWLLLLGFGLGPTFLAYWLFVSGLYRVRASEAAVLTLSETFVAVLLGVAWLGEYLSPSQFAGAIMVVAAGVAVALQRNRPRRRFSSESRDNQ